MPQFGHMYFNPPTTTNYIYDYSVDILEDTSLRHYPRTPNPEDFSSAAEYNIAMRRYLIEVESITEQQMIREKNINTQKELLYFIRFVKDQLKDNVNKSDPNGLNLIEDLLSEDKMKEIVDNYFC